MAGTQKGRTTEQPSPDGADEAAPKSVRTIRVLGKGRAAQAVLVEASMPDGRKQICVEKVFSTGWLTRAIYRLSFQSPFAYQSNRDAILACFYRRRVASAVLASSDTGVKIAAPLYIRFDKSSRAWVLAADWIDGRGIKPAPADSNRIRRRFRKTKQGDSSPTVEATGEIDTLVDTMHQLESLLGECGLVGSGWQVAPRALVSTANLLRDRDHYTVIDLESGIPAVLVPKYLLSGARRAELPPFDDLDESKLRAWIEQHAKHLLFRLGPDGLSRLRKDAEKLIEHSAAWKASELAFFRRPWRLLRRQGMAAYQNECIRRWQRDQTIDEATAMSLSSRRWKARLIWYAGLLPGAMGRAASRAVGNEDYRSRLFQCLRDRDYRAEQLDKLIRDRETKWIDAHRISPESRLTTRSFLIHQLLQTITPRSLHRLIADRRYRRHRLSQILLLLLSSRYQSWFGYSRIESAIDSWQRAERISNQEADQLRRQLSGNEVRAYVRGFGAHLALKTLTPIVAPAKYGGLAAFIASGNFWFLLPMLVMPAARSMVTVASWWSTRHDQIPHSEALLAGVLPVVGSAAFPLQMFAARQDLSIFLIRDTASKLGRRFPIYGGPNSRTEIAMIRSTDFLIEVLDSISNLSQKVKRPSGSSLQPEESTILKIPRRRGIYRWLDRMAARQIAEHELRRADRRNQTSTITMDRLEAA